MAKICNEEFKKHVVKDYIQGRITFILEKEYGVVKSTIFE